MGRVPSFRQILRSAKVMNSALPDVPSRCDEADALYGRETEGILSPREMNSPGTPGQDVGGVTACTSVYWHRSKDTIVDVTGLIQS